MTFSGLTWTNNYNKRMDIRQALYRRRLRKELANSKKLVIAGAITKPQHVYMAKYNFIKL